MLLRALNPQCVSISSRTVRDDHSRYVTGRELDGLRGLPFQGSTTSLLLEKVMQLISPAQYWKASDMNMHIQYWTETRDNANAF